MIKKSQKKPAAQIIPARKAAQKKAEAKRPQPSWLQRNVLKAPATIDLPAPERTNEANQPRGPPRLLSKAEVLDLVGCSFPTLWSWQRQGKFPRARRRQRDQMAEP